MVAKRHICKEMNDTDYHIIGHETKKEGVLCTSWHMALSVCDDYSEANFYSKEIFFCPWCGKRL